MNPLQRGVFLDLATVDRDDLDLSALRASLPEWGFHPRSSPQQRDGRIARAEVIVTNKVVIDAEALEIARDLKLICAAATGTNNIDVETARRRGIVVCNARDYATDSVVQHVFTLLLTLVTRLDDYRADIRAGRWSAADQFCLLDHRIRTLAGMRLGIIGWGVLGQATARLARAFGMEVLVAASHNPAHPTTSMDYAGERLPLDTLLTQADVVSLHCPLTPQTRHLIDAAALQRMQPGSLLLNTARGALVDPEALAQTLRTGHLGGAGIDVMEPEPPPPDHPLLAPDIPNLILTPHTAWAAHSARQRVIDQIVANIRAFVAGAPRNVVE
ncbi:D-2-hydroxyacid dehydrogenase [Thioalkalivibrio sp. ALJT]|uniref:D-2-hydroxyacid dehydrogenase n=1 Tax=Thioalkalivibrio sp. ALJT TaxID=1158146 RepID=UPI0003AA7688|nr:D-2-hydroxyacid dehydrogenase [Thioalkalivibrio sp. ALJT]